MIFPEHGNNLENWHHGSYQDSATDSFCHHMQIESVPIGPIQDCIDSHIKPTGGSSLTLTVLNSTNTDEASHPMSFSFGETSTQGNLIDHDYCAYPKSGYSGMGSYHGAVNNGAFMQSEQVMFLEIPKYNTLQKTRQAIICSLFVGGIRHGSGEAVTDEKEEREKQRMQPSV